MITADAQITLEIKDGHFIISRNCQAEQAVAMLTAAAGGLMGEHAPMNTDEKMHIWAAKYGAALGRSMTRIITERINERLEMLERE